MLLWNDADTSGRNAHNAWSILSVGASDRKLGCQSLHQQAADELGRDDLGGAAEEGLGEVLGKRGGYGSGLVRLCVLRDADA